MEESNHPVHRVRLLRGITKPNKEFAGWGEAEKVVGLGWRTVVLSFVSAIVAGGAGYAAIQVLGVRQENLAPPGGDFQMSEQVMQWIAVGTGAIGGLIDPIIVMAVMALIFLIFFSDIGYKKLFAVELYLQTIAVIGGIVTGILMIVFKSDHGQ
ncbi:MAG TPA: hypothetical protein VFK27_00795, partial [Bacillales bacterium]|nr:hypothetical protein [Bacillales bacterium]